MLQKFKPEVAIFRNPESYLEEVKGTGILNNLVLSHIELG